jgi:DNA (cytosine-5)-methyltransferase 1
VDEKFYLSDKAITGYLAHTDRHKERGNGFKFEPTDGNVTAHTISTRAGQRPTDNYVAIKTANKTGYDLATDGDGIDLGYPDSKTRRGRVGHGVSKTLPTSDSQGVMDGYRIRKLTPLECWRLMGFDDSDFHKAEKVNSNTQLYKQAGNSIVVNVLEAILEELLHGSAD